MAVAFPLNADLSLKLPTQAELIAADATTRIISLVKGKDGQGVDWWAFVGVYPSKYQEFHAKTLTHESFQISEYGEIVHSGDGLEPSADDYAYMQREFGWREGYVESMVHTLKEQQKEAQSKKEEVRINDIVAMLKMQKNQ